MAERGEVVSRGGDYLRQQRAVRALLLLLMMTMTTMMLLLTMIKNLDAVCQTLLRHLHG
jgi:hypothetical protein